MSNCLGNSAAWTGVLMLPWKHCPGSVVLKSSEHQHFEMSFAAGGHAVGAMVSLMAGSDYTVLIFLHHLTCHTMYAITEPGNQKSGYTTGSEGAMLYNLYFVNRKHVTLQDLVSSNCSSPSNLQDRTRFWTVKQFRAKWRWNDVVWSSLKEHEDRVRGPVCSWDCY